VSAERSPVDERVERVLDAVQDLCLAGADAEPLVLAACRARLDAAWTELTDAHAGEDWLTGFVEEIAALDPDCVPDRLRR